MTVIILICKLYIVSVLKCWRCNLIQLLCLKLFPSVTLTTLDQSWIHQVEIMGIYWCQFFNFYDWSSFVEFVVYLVKGGSMFQIIHICRMHLKGIFLLPNFVICTRRSSGLGSVRFCVCKEPLVTWSPLRQPNFATFTFLPFTFPQLAAVWIKFSWHSTNQSKYFQEEDSQSVIITIKFPAKM